MFVKREKLPANDDLNVMRAKVKEFQKAQAIEINRLEKSQKFEEIRNLCLTMEGNSDIDELPVFPPYVSSEQVSFSWRHFDVTQSTVTNCRKLVLRNGSNFLLRNEQDHEVVRLLQRTPDEYSRPVHLHLKSAVSWETTGRGSKQQVIWILDGLYMVHSQHTTLVGFWIVTSFLPTYVAFPTYISHTVGNL